MPRGQNDPGHKPGCTGAAFRDIQAGYVQGAGTALVKRRKCSTCGVVHWWDPKPGPGQAGRWRLSW